MKTQLPEPEAFRFDYDGYGWSYRDNGSGSSWKDMDAPDKEFMFTEAKLRAAMVAVWNEAIEEAAMVCRDMKQECGEPDSMQACLNRQMMSCSDAILKLKETP